MKKKGLSRSFIITLVILSVMLTIGMIVAGIIEFRDSTISLYTDFAYQIADTARGYFTDEELEQWAECANEAAEGKLSENEKEKIINNPDFQDKKVLLDKLRKSTGANDILVFYMDMDTLNGFTQEGYDNNTWKPIRYVMDCYMHEDEQFQFGDSSRFLPEFIDRTRSIIESGSCDYEALISDGEFGYNTNAIMPIVKDGKTVACISVEIPMTTLQTSIKAFIKRVVIISIIIVVILLALFVLLFTKKLINPIITIANEADSFAKNSENISNKLPEISMNNEIGVLAESLYKLEIDVNEYIKNITKITAEKERIGAELDVAKQIQATSLPNIFPAFPDKTEFDIYATMNPAKEVGGDFYDFYLIDDDHLALTIADVSGKGVPAALFMMIAKTLLKNQSYFSNSPKNILEIVNNQLCENNKAEMFVTVWLGILELSTGKMVAANAGHEFPAICRADGQFELIKDKHGFVLAGMEDVRYKEYEFDVRPGDVLFVYTDGVPEATNSKNEMFGTDKMLDALNEMEATDIRAVLTNVRNRIDNFVGDAPQFDDITMLGIYYKG